MSGLAVLVCGGRDFADWYGLEAFLDDFHARRPIMLVINGGARGADSMGADWAKKQPGVQCVTVPADWKTHGKAAGPIRNQKMLDRYRPHVVIAFPGGSGTAHMVKIARAAGVEVIEPMITTDRRAER